MWGAFRRAGLPVHDEEPPLRQIHEIAERYATCERPAGFKSAVLVYDLETLKQLFEANPSFRVLVGLRDPVEWAWSWFWYQRRIVEDACKTEGPETPDGKGLRSSPMFDRDRLSKVRASDFVKSDVPYPKLSRKDGLFHALLGEMFACFPRERIMLFDVAELSSNWRRTVARCLQFIEADCLLPDPIHGNVNQRKPASSTAPEFETIAYQYYEDSYDKLCDFLTANDYADLAKLFSERSRTWSKKVKIAQPRSEDSGNTNAV